MHPTQNIALGCKVLQKWVHSLSSEWAQYKEREWIGKKHSLSISKQWSALSLSFKESVSEEDRECSCVCVRERERERGCIKDTWKEYLFVYNLTVHSHTSSLMNCLCNVYILGMLMCITCNWIGCSYNCIYPLWPRQECLTSLQFSKLNHPLIQQWSVHTDLLTCPSQMKNYKVSHLHFCIKHTWVGGKITN